MQVIHNDSKRASGQKRGRGTNCEELANEHYHNKSGNKKRCNDVFVNEFVDPETSQHHTATGDSSNSEPTTTPPPSLPRSKPSKAKGPATPSLPGDKPKKHSELTPESTPLSKQRGEPAVTGQEGVKRRLFDLIETEGKKYIRKLRKAARLSESEINSAEELAKSGATLSELGETIQKLGKRLISNSKDRFDEYVKSLTQPSSPDQ